VHHSTIHEEKIQQNVTMYQSFIPYLFEDQYVSGETPPIIRSLKLHWQPLVFHNTVECFWTCGRWTLSGLTTSTDHTSNNLPQYYEKPEAANVVLGS
jgi:hypothetical protein